MPLLWTCHLLQGCCYDWLKSAFLWKINVDLTLEWLGRLACKCLGSDDQCKLSARQQFENPYLGNFAAILKSWNSNWKHHRAWEANWNCFERQSLDGCSEAKGVVCIETEAKLISCMKIRDSIQHSFPANRVALQNTWGWNVLIHVAMNTRF